jgi:hypothetical protein
MITDGRRERKGIIIAAGKSISSNLPLIGPGCGTKGAKKEKFLFSPQRAASKVLTSLNGSLKKVKKIIDSNSRSVYDWKLFLLICK